MLGAAPGERSGWADIGVAAVVAGWIAAVLSLDSISSLGEQRWLGVGTWLLLAACLRRQPIRTRVQIGIVVAFATAVEYTFAGELHVYVYRLHDIPWFVPPGHGLVYLAALRLGGSRQFRRAGRFLVPAVFAGGAAYAAWGLFASARLDVLGAIWFGCLAGFLLFGRAPNVYAAAFLVVTYLEILGTHLGAWTWSAHDPTGLVAIGNPPSGAAGGYCFFDAAALALAPRLTRTVECLGPALGRMLGAGRRPGRSGASAAAGSLPQVGENGFVEQPVAGQDAAAVGVRIPVEVG